TSWCLLHSTRMEKASLPTLATTLSRRPIWTTCSGEISVLTLTLQMREPWGATRATPCRATDMAHRHREVGISPTFLAEVGFLIMGLETPLVIPQETPLAMALTTPRASAWKPRQSTRPCILL